MWITRRDFQRLLVAGACSGLPWAERSYADTSQDIRQPFAAQLERLLTALNSIGEPLRPDEQKSLHRLLAGNASDTVARCEEVLRPHVLLRVDINPESRVTMTRGDAKAELVEHGWRTFLVRVSNESADTSPFQITSPQAGPMGRPSGNDTVAAHDFTIGAVDEVEAESRWIALNNWTSPPLLPRLSGLSIEYRILQIYSRDHGQREASLTAEAGAEQQDLGFGSTVPILFQCLPSNKIKIHVHDPVGDGATASLLITDGFGRVYPTQGKRGLPDLWFQPQIYREDGESIDLSDGAYSLVYGRGPEYVEKQIQLHVQGASPGALQLDLERWVQPKKFGYYSGDSHIHAAGCSHYESPTEGVTPEVMRRQVEGEALDVGSVLIWAPGWYYQSQFFTGHADHSADHTPDPSLLRYDVEVSGFPCSHSGHLVLLRLAQESYPGAKSLDDWPSWNLPVVHWAKSQGAYAGYAHTGWGMVTASSELPNYLIPAFDSCGANECIIDVTHPGMVDFMSGCDLWPFVELNIWYHILNSGFTLAFAGETDFPCITDHCVGGGRSYVQLSGEPSGDSGYSDWVRRGMKEGRSYFGDGRSHIFDLAVQDAHSGDELRIEGASDLQITATACAWLAPDPAAGEKIRSTSPYRPPYWHVERARIGDSRQVAVELVVNGLPVQRTTITADGTLHPVQFTQRISRSSWVALRIYPSCHTNPVTVQVGGQPIRASKKSAQWCRAGVDACWEQKRLRIRPSELEEAARAYDHARAVYDRIIAESDV